ncbi:RNA dependent RNA polymerase [Oceanobacillus oncorhynchi]|uniref:RNA dependent RNA polymerase n=1 Tax=Oceanobacillus oncorhynchi TaxID=545501 RepID=UPI0034D6D1DB
MGGNLQNQIHLFSIDTSAFYTDSERKIHRKIIKTHVHKNKLKNSYKDRLDYQARRKFTTNRVKQLKARLLENIKTFDDVRELDKDALKENAKISIFESSLTRTLGIPIDSLTEDIFIVRVYYFDILKQLIKDGFYYKGEKYVYFSSSAGQIRTKKGVFIKKSKLDKHLLTLTCGLTVDKINQLKGANTNKYLAYLALANSASQKMTNFDIDKCIVVNDLETKVRGMVDFIDRDTYEITPKEMDVPIEHTDGCGMMLPSYSKKSFMVRLPFIKGLLTPFAYDDFIKEFNGSSKITDIYGDEWDIFDDDIQIIFTKSQFKMSKYYENWNDYKEKFKQHQCEASMLNEEEDELGEIKLNYQMLQTLTDMTDDELIEIAQDTIDDIREVGSNKDTMLRILGAKKPSHRQNYFQKSLAIYPELLGDVHSRQVIKDVRRSMIKDAKSGKLQVSGIYTFVIPDMFAFCQYLFLGIENPNGLLNDGEVYCSVFDKDKEIDLLRSPHLYREHGVRKNARSEIIDKWFTTKGVYGSTKDLISKLLQYDNDGDFLMVVDDPTFVAVAKRHMKGVRPLYYEMAVAPIQKIKADSIYNGLIQAFKENIGIISNDITKIWNSEIPDLKVIKWKTMENNFSIDRAKTLFMPIRPKKVDDEIRSFTKEKVPHFFKYAKDKPLENVAEINNSVINRLDKIVPDKRIRFQHIAGKMDYKYLMKNPKTTIDEIIVKKYIEINKKKHWHIGEYDSRNGNLATLNKTIRDEFISLNNDIYYVVDVLIKHLYYEKNSKSKNTLWDSFGDVIYQNIYHNTKKTAVCQSCGDRFKYKTRKGKYCEPCAKNHKVNLNKRYRKVKSK